MVEKGAVFVGAVLGDGAGEIKFAGTGTAAMASNISGFSIVVLADGGADRLTLVSANLTGVTGGMITVEGGNDGNRLSEAGVARADDAILKGGAGNDTLIAGRHAAMTGGLGADVFELTTPGATTTPNNKNKITDFTPGTDEIAFSDAGFKLGLSGASGTPQALPVDLSRRRRTAPSTTPANASPTTRRTAASFTTLRAIPPAARANWSPP